MIITGLNHLLDIAIFPYARDLCKSLRNILDLGTWKSINTGCLNWFASFAWRFLTQNLMNDTKSKGLLSCTKLTFPSSSSTQFFCTKYNWFWMIILLVQLILQHHQHIHQLRRRTHQLHQDVMILRSLEMSTAPLKCHPIRSTVLLRFLQHSTVPHKGPKIIAPHKGLKTIVPHKGLKIIVPHKMWPTVQLNSTAHGLLQTGTDK